MKSLIEDKSNRNVRNVDAFSIKAFLSSESGSPTYFGGKIEIYRV